MTNPAQFHTEYEESGRPSHVHDLPQIYTRPSFQALADALDLLKLQPATFSVSPHKSTTPTIDPDGVPRYLTSIISSSLAWLSDDQKELIWDIASARLSERSGRTAMPSMTRSFMIDEEVSIDLFEPSLTEDNLGMKTWTSSLLLARRLPTLRHHLPPLCTRVLELGSGTGLVGIAAAVLWKTDVRLTDLPEIVPNLQQNVQTNTHLLVQPGSNCDVRSLDWSDMDNSPSKEAEKFHVVIAADPIYSPDHPKMLVDAVKRWSVWKQTSRFIVELPLRKGYEKERQDLRARLVEAGMELVEEDTEIGYDDWQGSDGRPAEVECWWSVWRPSST